MIIDMKCCGVKLTRCTKGIGHLVERHECVKCGEKYQPFLLTEATGGGIKRVDAKVADCLESQITWIQEEQPK